MSGHRHNPDRCATTYRGTWSIRCDGYTLATYWRTVGGWEAIDLRRGGRRVFARSHADIVAALTHGRIDLAGWPSGGRPDA